MLVPADRLYYLTDSNQNVTAVTNAAGVVQERYDYDAYGSATIYSADWSMVRTASAVGNTRLFAGQDLDTATGLVYSRARWYNPATGGFIGRDPLGFAAGDANVYRYVGNSPLMYTDPSGLCRQDDDFLTTSGGFFYGFGMGLKGAAEGFGGMFKTAGEGWGDLAFAAYNGDFNDPWLATNAAGNEFNGTVDGLAQTYLTLSEDPSLVLDVAISDTTNWLLGRLSTPQGIGGLAADVFLTLAPSSKGFLGGEADAKIGQFLNDESGSLRIGKTQGKLHGNTAGNQPATLYEKYDANGVFQKHGVSQDLGKRYTQKELNGGYLIETQRGPRKEMLRIERDLVERSPGPQNMEPWAGKRLGE